VRTAGEPLLPNRPHCHRLRVPRAPEARSAALRRRCRRAPSGRSSSRMPSSTRVSSRSVSQAARMDLVSPAAASAVICCWKAPSASPTRSSRDLLLCCEAMAARARRRAGAGERGRGRPQGRCWGRPGLEMPRGAARWCARSAPGGPAGATHPTPCGTRPGRRPRPPWRAPATAPRRAGPPARPASPLCCRCHCCPPRPPRASPACRPRPAPARTPRVSG
jgi:hypothetical protein